MKTQGVCVCIEHGPWVLRSHLHLFCVIGIEGLDGLDAAEQDHVGDAHTAGAQACSAVHC